MSTRKEKIKVYEMTCISCEKQVERAIKKLEGVINAKANYSGQFVEVEYEDTLCNVNKIKASIKSAGYSTERSNDYKFMGILMIVAAVVLLGLKTSGFDMESKLTNASYAVLFVVGILTSLHCVGMCGGIMLSQSLSKQSNNKTEAILPAILYNLGRVVSYTILGGIVGALGSIVSLSITAKAAMQVFAGVFMIIMGFNMAGFSTFRKFNIKLPHAVCKVKNKSGSPFIVGLLNGLMPCGPLQTMQLFALGTGSAIKGALSMFMFSIGTVPLMLTFGALSGLLSKGYTKKILKFSGVLIIVLGIIMGNRGLVLAGININPMTALVSSSKNLLGGGSTSNTNITKATIKDGVQIINMSANNNGYTPNAFYVQKGLPVKWIINGDQLNSCNNSIIIQSLNKEQRLKKGENVIEFTPGDEDINFSCWMGMIRGVIKVTDNLDSVDTSKSDPSIPPASTGPSCCAGPVADDGSDSTASNKPSIYGNDLTKVPTNMLVNKSLAAENYQSAKFKGDGYELQPLIIVTSNSLKTKLTFDLKAFDNAEGQYVIVNANTGDEVSSFTGKKGLNEVELNPKKVGAYAVVKDNTVLGIIEVVDNFNGTDLEEIRNKYLRQQ
ncbi:sulfite exporter TauE/SafE/plastocyanin domain-containing protein [Clostridium tetanomorphum]|uniref:Heavy metal transport/detoxification protein n=1 Tax=Clostridium tetanomorphum TaxID=1553 RepID=A0A923E8Z4_CLOTT|nr:sulfite exporter TauE/SafE family protein [Clostridium tetanomorphum]KAJ53545.1 heavy metal-associated domain-containing protein [Clostridium tetanomorphum DSM 665]MBC2396916.1 heavy metal transport/detoxification protein [Clostridium tetanomorphum]MBP1863117.1 sulfite exporter TauE/SafE/plastocyanin domain-containing protein [Clostridium tetanomorphum]NRS84226.1 sulfite exporter TauE/SafE/plastocyanin domain-containing protein [Clostridium tetanomorphum]NRZ97439.1 sulfite exporter TauE/Saf